MFPVSVSKTQHSHLHFLPLLHVVQGIQQALALLKDPTNKRTQNHMIKTDAYSSTGAAATQHICSVYKHSQRTGSPFSPGVPSLPG